MSYNVVAKLDGFLNADGDLASIEVLSFNLGVAAPAGGSSGRATGRVRFEDLVIVKHLDEFSPKLLHTAVQGQRIQQGTLYVLPAVQTGETRFEKWRFSDMFIVSLQTTGNEHGDVLPLEQISFQYSSYDLSVGFTEPSNG